MLLLLLVLYYVQPDSCFDKRFSQLEESHKRHPSLHKVSHESIQTKTPQTVLAYQQHYFVHQYIVMSVLVKHQYLIPKEIPH